MLWTNALICLCSWLWVGVNICLWILMRRRKQKTTSSGSWWICDTMKVKSPHWGLNPGPSVYKTDALPLSYRGDVDDTLKGCQGEVCENANVHRIMWILLFKIGVHMWMQAQTNFHTQATRKNTTYMSLHDTVMFLHQDVLYREGELDIHILTASWYFTIYWCTCLSLPL